MVAIDDFKLYDTKVRLVGGESRSIEMYLYPLDRYMRFLVFNNHQQQEEVNTLEEAVVIYNQLCREN